GRAAYITAEDVTMLVSDIDQAVNLMAFCLRRTADKLKEPVTIPQATITIDESKDDIPAWVHAKCLLQVLMYIAHSLKHIDIKRVELQVPDEAANRAASTWRMLVEVFKLTEDVVSFGWHVPRAEYNRAFSRVEALGVLENWKDFTEHVLYETRN
ncbi:unnamed protein product, partial [Effrenium voratum]